LFVDAAKDHTKDHTKDRKTDRNAPSGLREDLFDLRALARNAGDSLSGRAALENLIDNAVKFTDGGGVALVAAPEKAAKTSIKTSMKAGKGRVGVTFAVSDSGIGLKLAEIKRLFRPFSQANVSI